jgi:hypothetical protein
VAWLYAACNFAVGIAFLVAFALKNRSMLFILILIRLLPIYMICSTCSLVAPCPAPCWSSPSSCRSNLPTIYALRTLCKEINEEQRTSN